MPDFHQSETITTLHALGPCAVNERFSSQPGVVVLPVHAKDLRLATIPATAAALRRAPLVDEVILALDHARGSDISLARSLFAGLRDRLRIVHTNGPLASAFFARLAARGLAPYAPGKGSNLALGLWSTLARHRTAAIAFLDIDLVEDVWSEDITSRLLRPLLLPRLGLDAVKAYYARIHRGRFRGRVTRLLVAPLFDVMTRRIDHGLLRFLREFRYPLSGEIALRSALAARLRISQGWGIDMRLLSEIWSVGAAARTAQVDVGVNHDHRHPALHARTLGTSHPRGVARMAVEVAFTMFDALTEAGAPSAHAPWTAFRAELRAAGVRYMQQYARDSLFNGLSYVRSEERQAMALFIRAIGDAWRRQQAGQREVLLPSWNQLREADPAITRLASGLAE